MDVPIFKNFGAFMLPRELTVCYWSSCFFHRLNQKHHMFMVFPRKRYDTFISLILKDRSRGNTTATTDH